MIKHRCGYSTLCIKVVIEGSSVLWRHFSIATGHQPLLRQLENMFFLPKMMMHLLRCILQNVKRWNWLLRVSRGDWLGECIGIFHCSSSLADQIGKFIRRIRDYYHPRPRPPWLRHCSCQFDYQRMHNSPNKQPANSPGDFWRCLLQVPSLISPNSAPPGVCEPEPVEVAIQMDDGWCTWCMGCIEDDMMYSALHAETDILLNWVITYQLTREGNDRYGWCRCTTTHSRTWKLDMSSRN